MPDLDINFQFQSNAQSLEATSREVKVVGENFARVIVDEVALAASKDSFEKGRRTFVSSVRSAIMAEVSRMAMMIGKFLPLPDKYNGPNGDMSLGELSGTATLFRFEQTFNRKSTNVDWSKRSKKYLRWKSRSAFNTGKWWELRGTLKRDMQSKGADFYEAAFGPIRVRFERPPPGRGSRGRFSANNNLMTSAVRPAVAQLGETASLHGSVNASKPGGRGRLSAEYRVGTLQVDVFGKITPAMLPALRNMDPKKADAFPGEGVVGLFPNDGPGGVRNKLLGTRAGRHYRYAVEPFVSFFLTRAIPNAVWRRTENIVSGNVSRASGIAGLGSQFVGT